MALASTEATTVEGRRRLVTSLLETLLAIDARAAAEGPHNLGRATDAAPDRTALAKLLRTALALAEDSEARAQPEVVSRAVARALEGLSDGLTAMADHAGLLAEEAQAALTPRSPRPN